jgi:hypothetical protein
MRHECDVWTDEEDRESETDLRVVSVTGGVERIVEPYIEPSTYRWDLRINIPKRALGLSKPGLSLVYLHRLAGAVLLTNEATGKSFYDARTKQVQWESFVKSRFEVHHKRGFKFTLLRSLSLLTRAEHLEITGKQRARVRRQNEKAREDRAAARKRRNVALGFEV